MSSDERRAAIIEAALPLVTEHGANVTTRQIAQAAEIAEGTVFRVFADKEELLHACVSEVFRTDHLRAQIEKVPTERDVEGRLVEAALLFSAHFARLGKLMQTLAHTGYDVHRVGPKRDSDGPVEFMRDLVEAINGLLEPDEQRFAVPIDDLARMLLGLVMSLRFDPHADEDKRARIVQRVDILLHGALRDSPNVEDELGRTP
jgi:AcrR family transcriptional regulator